MLERTGHTEAASIRPAAGVSPAGVICEVMNEDGTMARVDDPVGPRRKARPRMMPIADLIAYRRENEKLVERSSRPRCRPVSATSAQSVSAPRRRQASRRDGRRARSTPARTSSSGSIRNA